MKRFLLGLFFGLFVGNVVNAAAPSQKFDSENVFNIASNILDNIKEVDSRTCAESVPEQFRDILYNELLGQAMHRWSSAVWWNIDVFRDENIYSISLSADGNTLASGSNEGPVKIYQRTDQTGWGVVAKFDEKNGGHNKWVHSISLSSDGSMLASGSYDKAVKIYQKIDQDTWMVYTFSGPCCGLSEIKTVSLSADGKVLAFCSHDGEVRVCQRGNGGDWVCTAGPIASPNCVSRDWENCVMTISLSRDGDTLAYGLKNNTAEIYQRNSQGVWVLLCKFNAGGFVDRFYDWVETVSLSTDGNIFAYAVNNGGVFICEKSDGGCWNFVLKDKARWSDSYLSVALSANGNMLACGSLGGEIKLYRKNCQGGWVPMQDFYYSDDAFTKSVHSVALSADGRILAMATFNGWLRIYTLRNFETLENLLEFIKTL